MLTLIEKILFVIALFGSLYVSYITFRRMAAMIQQGQGRLRFEGFATRLLTGLKAFLLQGWMYRHRPLVFLFHLFVAVGFFYYGLVNLVDILEGFLPGFRFLGHSLAGGLYRLVADLLSAAVLVGMSYFLVRRFITGDESLAYRQNIKLHPQAAKGIPKDSLLVGGFILGHVGFHLLAASFLVAIEGGDAWQPVAGLLAGLWGGLSPAGLAVGWHISWWLALGLILAFVPYFPYTKHAHLFMGPFNFISRPEAGRPVPIDFEDESLEQFGAARLSDLGQTQIVDAFACIMCNRCQEACPAYLTGKELSPAALEINKRYYLRERMGEGGEDLSELLEYALSPSAVWACTTCGACLEVCPVGNEPMVDILDIRRDRVLMNGDFPPQLKTAFTGLERQANPWQMAEDRLAWTGPLDFSVPTVAENPDFELLYWVGCAGAFDSNARRVARAIATILHTAGVNFAVLGNDEACTGDMARRAGNEYLFYEMALANIETLNAIGADQKRIVTGCPHCLYTLGTEYADYGGHYRVLHHTQLIAELIGSGQLRLKAQNGRAVFHDPCYLGYHSGEYEAPRRVLAGAGLSLAEMERNRAYSFCCGAGGAQMWKEEEPGDEAVYSRRYAQARAAGAELAAVACPFCANMFNDANTEAGEPLRVKDVAEIVAESL